jgi:hypothetical protein
MEMTILPSDSCNSQFLRAISAPCPDMWCQQDVPTWAAACTAGNVAHRGRCWACVYLCCSPYGVCDSIKTMPRIVHNQAQTVPISFVS